jgi:hypothetical protein
MARDVDAVIAALRVALDEARKDGDLYWKVRNANRWINQLPGAWTGRWPHLKLSGDLFGQIYRTEFVGHVRATLAYLESNREFIRVTRIWSWPFKRAKQYPPDPIDAEFNVRAGREVTTPVRGRAAQRVNAA